MVGPVANELAVEPAANKTGFRGTGARHGHVHRKKKPTSFTGQSPSTSAPLDLWGVSGNMNDDENFELLIGRIFFFTAHTMALKESEGERCGLTG